MYFNRTVNQCVLNSIFVTRYLVYGSHICENYKYHTLYIINHIYPFPGNVVFNSTTTNIIFTSRPLSEKTIQNKNVNFNKYYVLYIRQV